MPMPCGFDTICISAYFKNPGLIVQITQPPAPCSVIHALAKDGTRDERKGRGTNPCMRRALRPVLRAPCTLPCGFDTICI
jgi:hypothetical protein